MPLTVHEARDGGDRNIRHPRNRRDSVPLGGDTGCLDIAPVEAAVFTVDIDELEIGGAHHFDDGRRREGQMDAADFLP
jgi:hypothetical protein